MTETTTQKHFSTLDGLRGLAVLYVFIFHFSEFESFSWKSEVYLRFVKLGWSGVDLFFVLSGFLLSGILIDSKNSFHYYRNFYIRRSLRILPLHYSFLILTLFILPLLSAGLADIALRGQKYWAPYFFFLANFVNMATGWKGNWLDPMWSLAVEEQFYFFWPKIVKSLSQSKLKFLCFAIILICPLIRLGLIVLEVNPLINYVFILSRLDALAVGGLVAILYREKSKILLDRNLAVLGALFGAGIAVVYYTSPFARTFASMFVGYSFLAVFYGALLASLLHPDEKHLRTRVFSYFF